jgi:hypothetical protein
MSEINYFKVFLSCTTMWQLMLDSADVTCVNWLWILTYVKNYIKWPLVCHLYIVREDRICWLFSRDANGYPMVMGQTTILFIVPASWGGGEI